MATVKTTYVAEYIISSGKALAALVAFEKKLSSVGSSSTKTEKASEKLGRTVASAASKYDLYNRQLEMQHRLQTELNLSKSTAAKIVSIYKNNLDEAYAAAQKSGGSTDNLRKKIDGLNKSLSNKHVKKFSSDLVALAATYISLTAAIALVRTALSNAFNSIKELEDGLVGLIKTTGLSGSELAKFKDDLRTLATKTTPQATKALLEYGQASGQMGLRYASDISLMVKITAELARAVDGISGADAARDLLQISRLSGETTTQVDNLSSALVELGNSTLSAEGPILAVASHLARSLTLYEVSSRDIAGYSAALSEFGEHGEAAGSAMAAAFSKINKALILGEKLEEFAEVAGLTTEEFKRLASASLNDAFLKVLEGISTKGKSAIITIQELYGKEKRVARVIGSLAKNYGRVSEILSISDKAFFENTARTKEAEAAFGTLSSRIQALYNSFGLLSEKGFEKSSKDVKKIIDGLTEFVVKLIESEGASVKLVQGGLIVFTKAAYALVEVLKFVIEHIDALVSIAAVLSLDAIISGVKALSTALYSNLLVAIERINIAILANPWVAAGAVIIATLFAINSAVKSSNEQTLKEIEALAGNSKKLIDQSEQVKNAIDGSNQVAIRVLYRNSEIQIEEKKRQFEEAKKTLENAQKEFDRVGKTRLTIWEESPEVFRAVKAQLDIAKQSYGDINAEINYYIVNLARLKAAMKGNADIAQDYNVELEEIYQRISNSENIIDQINRSKEARKEEADALKETEKEARELIDTFQDLRVEYDNIIKVREGSFTGTGILGFAGAFAAALNEEKFSVGIDETTLFADIDKIVEKVKKDHQIVFDAVVGVTGVSFTQKGVDGLAELGGRTATIAKNFADTSKKIQQLTKNLFEFGLSIDDVQKAVTESQLSTIFDIAEDQARRVGDEEELLRIQKQRQQLEQNLAKLEFEAAVAMVEFFNKGQIPEAIQKIIDKTRDLFDEANNAKEPFGGFFERLREAGNWIAGAAYSAAETLREAGEDSYADIVQGIGEIASGDYGAGVGSLARGLGLSGGGTGSLGGARSGTYAAELAELGNAIYPGWGAVIGAVVGMFIKSGADDARVAFDDLGNGVVEFAEGGLVDVANDVAGAMGLFFGRLQDILIGQLNIAEADISISMREDTVTVWANGIRRTFSDLNEAMAFAAQQVLLINTEADGIGENLKQLFEGFSNPFTVYGDVTELASAVELANLMDTGLGPSYEYLINLMRQELQLGVQFGLNSQNIINLTRQRIELEKQALHEQALGFAGVTTSISTFRQLRDQILAFNSAAEKQEIYTKNRMKDILEEVERLKAEGAELGLEGGRITSETITRWREEAREAGIEWEVFVGSLNSSEQAGIRIQEQIERLMEQYEALAESLGQMPEEFAEAYLEMLQEIERGNEQINLFQQILEFQEKYGVKIANSELIQKRMAELEFKNFQLRIKLLVLELAKNAELLGLSQSQVDMYMKWADEVSKLEFPGVPTARNPTSRRDRRQTRDDARETFRDEVEKLRNSLAGTSPSLISFVEGVEKLTEQWASAELSAEALAEALSLFTQIQVNETLKPFRDSIFESTHGELESSFIEIQDAVSSAISVLTEALKDDPEALRDAIAEIELGASTQLHDIAVDFLEGLGDSYISLDMKTRETVDSIRFLMDNLEEFGLTAQEVADSVSNSVITQILTIAERAASEAGDEEAAKEFKRDREKFEREYRILQLESLVLILEAAGAVNEEILAIVDSAREYLNRDNIIDTDPKQTPDEILADLGLEEARLESETAKLIERIKELIEGAEEFGVTVEQVKETIQAIALPKIISIAEEQARRIGDEEKLAALQKRRAELERAYQRLELELLYRQLEAAGAINQEFTDLYNDIILMLSEPTAEFEEDPSSKLSELAGTIGATTYQAIQSFKEFSEAIDTLSKYVESGAITAEEASRMIADGISGRLSSLAGSLLSFINTYYGEVKQGEELKKSQLKINYAIEMLQLETNYTMLLQAYAAGLIAEEQWISISDAMDFIRSNTPDFDNLGKSVQSLGSGASSAGSSISRAKEELASLKDELEGILKSSEDSKVGPLKRSLDEVFDRFQRVADIIRTLNLGVDDFNRSVNALVDELSSVYDQAFSPVDKFISEIEETGKSPAEAFREAESAFKNIAIPDNLESLSLDEIENILSIAGRYEQAGKDLFGEGFGSRLTDREILDKLEKLRSLKPEREDLVLKAIEFLSNGKTISLKEVESSNSSGFIGLTSSVDNLFTSNRDRLDSLLQSLGYDSELSKKLRDIFDRLGINSPISARLLTLVDKIGVLPFIDLIDAVKDNNIDDALDILEGLDLSAIDFSVIVEALSGMGFDNNLLIQIADNVLNLPISGIIDAVNNNDNQALLDLIGGIDFNTVEITGLFDALAALGVDNASLLSIADSVAAAIEPNNPQYAKLEAIKNKLKASIEVTNPDFHQLSFISALKAVTDSNAAILAGIKSNQIITNSGIQALRDQGFSLKDRVDTITTNIRSDIFIVDGMVRETRNLVKQIANKYLGPSALSAFGVVDISRNTSSLAPSAFVSTETSLSRNFSSSSGNFENMIISRVDKLVVRSKGPEILSTLRELLAEVRGQGAYTFRAGRKI